MNKKVTPLDAYILIRGCRSQPLFADISSDTIDQNASERDNDLQIFEYKRDSFYRSHS